MAHRETHPVTPHHGSGGASPSQGLGVVNDGTTAGWSALVPEARQVLMVAPLSGSGATQITYEPKSLVSQVAIDDSRVVWLDSREGHPNQIWTYVVP